MDISTLNKPKNNNISLRCIEFNAALTQVINMPDGTVNITLNLPEPFQAGVRVMRSWAGEELSVTLEIDT